MPARTDFDLDWGPGHRPAAFGRRPGHLPVPRDRRRRGWDRAPHRVRRHRLAPPLTTYPSTQRRGRSDWLFYEVRRGGLTRAPVRDDRLLEVEELAGGEHGCPEVNNGGGPGCAWWSADGGEGLAQAPSPRSASTPPPPSSPTKSNSSANQSTSSPSPTATNTTNRPRQRSPQPVLADGPRPSTTPG